MPFEPPRVRSAQPGRAKMFYVYILQSIDYPDKFYIGYTADLKQRLQAHNSGQSDHTNKSRPWKTKNYIAFDHEQTA